MTRIAIKNFGPIRSGCTTDKDGFIDINRITLLIGDQGSGKSTIAKLFSTCSWLEKALARGDFSIKWLCQYNRFQNNFCKYQNIQNYFCKETFIDYRGKRYNFTYESGKLSVNDTGKEYSIPQIMYIPAERNLLSVIEEAEKIRYLPQSLFTLLESYNQARKTQNKPVALPVDNLSFSYDKLNHISWLTGKDYRVRLSEASSGLQSLTPLVLVTHYLWSRISSAADTDKKRVSVQEHEKLKTEIERILSRNDVNEDVKAALIKQIPGIKNEYLINIVEEPEQNLFPRSQRSVLYELLTYIHKNDDNQFLFTTHSPYILSYLTLAVKAGELLKNAKLDEEKKKALDAIVPLNSSVDASDVSLYQLTGDGCVEPLANVNGLLEDNNSLNNLMAQTNDDFASLLDLED